MCWRRNFNFFGVVSAIFFPPRFICLYFRILLSRKTENLLSLIKAKAKKLLLPMYFWNTVYGFVVYMLSFKGFNIGGNFTLYNLIIEPIKTGHQFVWNLGTWFIWPLFLVEVIHMVLCKMFCIKRTSKKMLIIHVFYFILGIFCIYLSNLGYNHGWFLPVLRVMHFLPFYSFGIIYKDLLEEKLDRLMPIVYFILIFSLQLFIITLEGTTPNYSQAWCNFPTTCYIIPYVVGLLGILFWLKISKLLLPIVKNSKLIFYIADNTYAIMVHHLIGFLILKSFFALANRRFGIFPDFNWAEYYNNVWYLYLPKGLSQWLFVYVVFGIVTALLIDIVFKKIFVLIKRSKTCKTK